MGTSLEDMRRAAQEQREAREAERATGDEIRLEVGMKIAGRIEDIRLQKTQYGNAYVVTLTPAAVWDEEDNRDVVDTCETWLSGKVLRNMVEEQLPQVGERIFVERIEDGISNEGNSYRLYDFALLDRKPGEKPPEDAKAYGEAETASEFSEATVAGEDDLPF